MKRIQKRSSDKELRRRNGRENAWIKRGDKDREDTWHIDKEGGEDENNRD